MDNEVITLIAGLDGGATASVVFYIIMAHGFDYVFLGVLIWGIRAAYKVVKGWEA